MFKRNTPLVVAVAALMLPVLAGGDVLLHGSLALVHPALLLVWVFAGFGCLLFLLSQSEKNAAEAHGRANRLTSLTAEQQAFIAALEATNSRLNASEARYKGLVDVQGDAIVRRTQDGSATYVNEAFLRIFGVKSASVMGSPFQPDPHPESPVPVVGRFAGREMGRERVSYDQHVNTIAGYRWLAWEDYAVRDAQGRLVEIQSVGRDVTERKFLEGELTEARDRSEEANRAKSQFLATISHEIRTPMNGVLGMARLLLETELGPDQKAYSEAIHQSGLALLSLIEDLLDFSKIESGTLIIEANDTPLRPLVEGVSELLSTRAHAKGLNIVTSIASDVPEIICVDAIRLRQILTNLVGNAVKFTEEGGIHISATVERRDGASMLMLSVQDTGIGVPHDKQAKIF